MPDILVRRVPASIVSALKRRANRRGRSLQGEVVTISRPPRGLNARPQRSPHGFAQSC